MRRFARRFPAACMLLLTFAWSWAAFVSCGFLAADTPGLMLALYALGSFGPAVGGIVTLRLQAGEQGGGLPPVLPFLIGAGLAVAALACLRFDLFGIAQSSPLLAFPADTPDWVYAVMLAPVLVSGWVFASVGSRNRRLRAWFYGLVPEGRDLGLALGVLLFLPALLIGANLLADFFGLQYVTPRYRDEAVAQWLPGMAVGLIVAFAIAGGNEEHGWRGVLQPLLQRRLAPFWATLFIGMAWVLWQLPMVVGGVYGEGPWWQLTLGRMLIMVCYAYLLSFLYNGTRGSIFLCVLLHACVNAQVPLFFGSLLAVPLGWGIVLGGVLMLGYWRRENGYHPTLH